MNLPTELNRQYLKLRSFKTLVIMVFVYPILPLCLLASLVTFASTIEHIFEGSKNISLNQDLLYLLFVSGGISGLIGGVMVLKNRINSVSLLLYIHGAISYSFIAVNFVFSSSPPWHNSIMIQSAYDFSLPNILWLLHKSYIALTLLVVAYLLYLMVKKVSADYQTDKKVNASAFKDA